MAADPKPQPKPEAAQASPPPAPRRDSGLPRPSWLKTAAAGLCAVALVSALILKGPGGKAPSPAQAPAVEMPAPGLGMPEDSSAPEENGPPPQEALVPYGPDGKAAPGAAAAPRPAPAVGRASGFKAVPFLAGITRQTGATPGRLATSQVDNARFIQGTPVDAATARNYKPPQPAVAAVQDWYKVIPPCSWNVLQPGAYCITSGGKVTTAQTFRDCKAWGATDCAADNLASLTGVGPRGPEIPATYMGVAVKPAAAAANSNAGIFYRPAAPETQAPREDGVLDAGGFLVKKFAAPAARDARPAAEEETLPSGGKTARPAAATPACLAGVKAEEGRAIAVSNPLIQGTARLVGRCGGLYHYRFLNASGDPLKARLESAGGETWEVDLAPGAETVISSKSPLEGENALGGTLR